MRRWGGREKERADKTVPECPMPADD